MNPSALWRKEHTHSPLSTESVRPGAAPMAEGITMETRQFPAAELVMTFKSRNRKPSRSQGINLEIRTKVYQEMVA